METGLNIGTGEMSQAIIPIYFFDNFHSLEDFHISVMKSK